MDIKFYKPLGLKHFLLHTISVIILVSMFTMLFFGVFPYNCHRTAMGGDSDFQLCTAVANDGGKRFFPVSAFEGRRGQSDA